MGRIGFRIRSRLKIKEVPVYVYVYVPNGMRHECKTGLFIEGCDWRDKNQYATPNKPINVELNETLDMLRQHLLRKINTLQS